LRATRAQCLPPALRRAARCAGDEGARRAGGGAADGARAARHGAAVAAGRRPRAHPAPGGAAACRQPPAVRRAAGLPAPGGRRTPAERAVVRAAHHAAQVRPLRPSTAAPQQARGPATRCSFCWRAGAALRARAERAGSQVSLVPAPRCQLVLVGRPAGAEACLSPRRAALRGGRLQDRRRLANFVAWALPRAAGVTSRAARYTASHQETELQARGRGGRALRP